MSFFEGQPVLVIQKGADPYIDHVADVRQNGDCTLADGRIFDKQGRCKTSNLWNSAWIEEID